MKSSHTYMNFALSGSLLLKAYLSFLSIKWLGGQGCISSKSQQPANFASYSTGFRWPATLVINSRCGQEDEYPPTSKHLPTTKLTDNPGRTATQPPPTGCMLLEGLQGAEGSYLHVRNLGCSQLLKAFIKQSYTSYPKRKVSHLSHQVLLEHSPVPPLPSLSHAEGCQSLFVDLPQAPAFFQVP